MSSVHDNEIISYKVDLQNDQIIINTTNEGAKLVKETDIVFNDVLCYLFEQQLKGSIILNIYESDIKDFIKENTELLLKNKNYCWPVVFETLEELERKLINERYKYINLMSSYGMNGWVVAKSFEMIVRETLKND